LNRPLNQRPAPSFALEAGAAAALGALHSLPFVYTRAWPLQMAIVAWLAWRGGPMTASRPLAGISGVCLWAGDSRLYRLRNGQLTRLSRDHSAVQEMVEAGAITQAEADRHPKSNVITRAVGGAEVLFVDSAVFSPEAGDTYLLCSDGLYNEVAEDSIRRKLALPAEEAIRKLIDEALDNGGRDNISLVIVQVAGSN